MTLAGAMWCIVALALWPKHPVWSIPAGSIVTLVLLALCATRLRFLGNIQSIHDPFAATKGKRIGKLFGIVFAVESASIWLCAMLLAHLGLSIWIPIAIAFIVGLHFIPLARVFEAPIYYLTGVLCVAGMLGCSLIRDAHMRLLCVGLTMAAVFWMTAVVLLLQARHQLREKRVFND
jgi:hypothetical protein